MANIWNTVFYEPLYNALVFLIGHLPGGDVALAVIILTLIVRLILSPLSYRSVMNQVQQKRLQPYIKKIKEKYKDPKEQSMKIMEFYRANKSNPFSGCLLLLIQFPIIIALYTVFRRGVAFNADALYSAIPYPDTVNTLFLGFIDLTLEHSVILALLAGIAQLVHAQLSLAMKTEKIDTTDVVDIKNQKSGSDTKSSLEDFDQERVMQMVQKNFRYILPVMITVFAYIVPAAVALYWATSNMFTILQEIVIRRKFRLMKARGEHDNVIIP